MDSFSFSKNEVRNDVKGFSEIKGNISVSWAEDRNTSALSQTILAADLQFITPPSLARTVRVS